MHAHIITLIHHYCRAIREPKQILRRPHNKCMFSHIFIKYSKRLNSHCKLKGNEVACSVKTRSIAGSTEEQLPLV